MEPCVPPKMDIPRFLGMSIFGGDTGFHFLISHESVFPLVVGHVTQLLAWWWTTGAFPDHPKKNETTWDWKGLETETCWCRGRNLDLVTTYYQSMIMGQWHLCWLLHWFSNDNESTPSSLLIKRVARPLSSTPCFEKALVSTQNSAIFKLSTMQQSTASLFICHHGHYMPPQ